MKLQKRVIETLNVRRKIILNYENNIILRTYFQKQLEFTLTAFNIDRKTLQWKTTEIYYTNRNTNRIILALLTSE